MLGRSQALRAMRLAMDVQQGKHASAAAIIQALVRGHFMRRSFRRKWAAIKIQALSRGYIGRIHVQLTQIEPQMRNLGGSGFLWDTGLLAAMANATATERAFISWQVRVS